MIYAVVVTSETEKFLVEADSVEEAINVAKDKAKSELTIVAREADVNEKKLFEKRHEYVPLSCTAIAKGDLL